MTQFYTNVYQYGNKLLVREIKNGKKISFRHPYKPTLFVPTAEETRYRTMDGQPVGPVEFGDINDAKEFVQLYSGASNVSLYGNTSYAHQYLTETYPMGVDFDFSQLTILTIDIETKSENGFPDVEVADDEVQLITVQNYHTKKITTFGVKAFDVKQIKHITNTANYEYVRCKDEADLLRTFFAYIHKQDPDAITGWHIQFFDIPYLVTRANRILGDDAAKKMSPWNILNARKVEINDREQLCYDIVGVATLDMIDLYRKFTYVKQESYKLDHIAQVELGKGKLPMPYETLKECYEKDWQMYVEYNVVDVERVDELEQKMRLIELIVTMAYEARCNYIDVYSPVKMWDCILNNHMWGKHMVPGQPTRHERRTIQGAYVQEPVPGAYNWVVSFDATSLYPSVLMQYNMSPEKLVDGKMFDVTVDDLLKRRFDSSLVGEDCMAANGQCFKRDSRGLMPEVVEKMFAERVFYKKQMIKVEKEYEQTHDKSLLNEIARLNNIQMSKKIALNSLYGAMANVWFRHYDDRIAEGITLSGQLLIQSVAEAINVYLNKICDTTGVNYAFYGDTDSCYITLDRVVQKFFPNKDLTKTIDAIDKICEEKLTPIINAACSQVADYTNVFQPKIFFKRESIATRGLWVAKKRYALNVYDSEGVRYEDAKLKVMGLEVVRSSTPAKVRQFLRDGIKIALAKSQGEMHQYITEVEREFMQLSPGEIAFPKTANGMSTYASSDTIYTKGTPMHVRGSLLFNRVIKEKKLDKKYEIIREGDKMRYLYLKKPNPIGENCIAFSGTELPKELELTKYIDYETMFVKAFLDPMKNILVCLGWTTEPVATLDDIF